ncbi:MAG: hypothetical protein Q9227_008629 [Pyrenula ochraceoflavens]
MLALLLFLLPLAAAQCWRNVTCNGPGAAAFPGPWDANIYAPATRAVAPRSILSWPDLAPSQYPGSPTISGNGSLVTYDFGTEVGGIVTATYSALGSGQLGFAFTEARNFVGYTSDSSNGHFPSNEGALYTTITPGNATWTMPDERLRGGFRYMTIFLITNGTASATLGDISVELDFQPTWPNLQAYQGYFHCSDELLNRIWYAGAYTLQSNSVPTDTGRQVPMLTSSWANNATLGPGDTIIVDGAKRDRAVWPGDMGVAVPSTFVSVGDLDSVKNALQVMYDYQADTGAFDESGPPLSQKGSDTYHMWTMIGTYNYYLYTADLDFLTRNWPKYQLAMTYITSKIDSSNLLNVTGIRDWARWQQGFHNTEANTILYHTLNTGAKLATWLNATSLASNWTTTATTLASAINTACYDPTYGAYRDNDTTTTLHPQDANSLSLLFSIPPDSTTTSSILTRLTSNWTPLGPVTPELPNNISPFITSFELTGRLTTRDTARALSLLRTTWGWILNNPNSTSTTLLEGYLANGSFSYRSDRGYGYDASYPSHAHGWSTGPTSALTNYIVGLDVVEPAGRNWTLAPQFGDLSSAEGGFTTPLGRFSARWSTDDGGATYDLSWAAPEGTSGTLRVPTGEGTNSSSSSSSSDNNNNREIQAAKRQVRKKMVLNGQELSLPPQQAPEVEGEREGEAVMQNQNQNQYIRQDIDAVSGEMLTTLKVGGGGGSLSLSLSVG